MVMSSHQISQMASSQSAMFGQFQSYSQQITPPYGSSPGMGYGSPPTGYVTGPTPSPPPMTPWSPTATPHYGGGMMQMLSQMPYAQVGSGYGQALGENVFGGGLRAASAGISGLSTAVGVGGLIGMGGSALGIGGAGMATLGAMGGFAGLPIMGGLAAAGYGANQMMEGHQQRQQVNQVLRNRFGGAMGIGSGRGGMGFGNQEMGGISTMLREMGTEDIFTNMEELTRVMDKTAQMGIYKGISSARQFRQRFQQTVDSLKEISRTMNTTLEGAAEFFNQSRGMGFFSGQDISRNLMQTRLGASATGMSVPQMQQIGQMGTQMGMAMGWRGRVGAQAAQNIATNIGTSVRSGGLSEEMLFEATGGLTGAQGVQALTSRMMQVNNRFLSRGAGRVLNAAMWDPESGGVDQSVMEQVRNGEISFQEARRIGRRKIAQTGGRRSEFFANEERLRGQAMEAGGSDLAMGMIESHFGRRGRRDGVDLDDPIVQRFMRRRMRMSQSEVEAFVQLRRDMPQMMQERRRSMRQDVQNMIQTRRREGQGLEGVRRRWSQWWSQSVEDPLRQAADDMQTTVSEGIEGMMNEIEGRVQTSLTSHTRSLVTEWARTGQRPAGMMSTAQLTRFTAEARRRGENAEVGEGFLAGLGRSVGARGPNQIQALRAAKANTHGLSASATTQERAEFLQRMQKDLSMSYSDFGVSSAEMKDYGNKALDHVYSSMSDVQREEWVNNRSNKNKAITMAKQRIGLLRKTEWGRKLFDRTKTWYQSYALLSDLDESSGLGVLGIDEEAMPGGGGSFSFQRTIAGAREMQSEAIDDIVRLSRRGRSDTKWKRAGWGEKLTRGTAFVASLTASEWLGGEDSLGSSISGLFGREGKIGGGVDHSTANRLLKNVELREDLRLAQGGDKAAERRLLRASLGEGASTTYGEAQGDRNEMQTLINMATKGSQAEKDALKNYIDAAQGEGDAILSESIQRTSAELSRYTSRNADTLRAGMGEEAYSQYQKVLEAQQKGDIEASIREEKMFFQKYGGSKEGNFLLAHLRKGGVGVGLQEGLSTMADYTRFFRGQDSNQKARSLIERTLASAGVRDQKSIRNLLGGRGQTRFMRDVRSGKVDASELAKRLVAKMDDPQKQALFDRGMTQQDLVKQLTEQISRGEGGVTDEELRESLTGQAQNNSWGARVDGAKKDEVDTAERSFAALKESNILLKAILMKTAGDDKWQALIDAAKNSGKDGKKDDEETEGGK